MIYLGDVRIRLVVILICHNPQVCPEWECKFPLGWHDVLDLLLVLDLHQSQDQVTNECNSQPGGDDVDTAAK